MVFFKLFIAVVVFGTYPPSPSSEVQSTQPYPKVLSSLTILFLKLPEDAIPPGNLTMLVVTPVLSFIRFSCFFRLFIKKLCNK